MGDIVKFYSGLTYSPENVIESGGTFVLRSSNVVDGEIVDADNVYVNSDVVNCNNVEVGDVIVVVRNGSRNLIGKHAQIKTAMADTVIGAFMTGLRSTQPEFANALLDTQQFDVEITKNLGATINQITTGAFKQMTFSIPQSTPEQTAIGSFFRTLDNTITLHKRKLDSLKKVKMGYLQQMFPQEGESVPRVRFVGFTGDWKQRNLGEVAEITGGGTPDTTNFDYWDGDFDWYSPVEIGKEIYAFGSQRKITELGLKKSSAKILPANRTILFTSRAGIGDMAILKNPAATNQGFQSLVVNDNYDVYFIYSMGSRIKEYALKNASGSTFLEISGKGLSKMEVLIPSAEEQYIIGNFFHNLDEQITTQQTKLDKLKQLKQAYLQKMFV